MTTTSNEFEPADDVELVDDADDTETEEWTPPTKEEWDRLQVKKSKADSEAAQRKRWLLELGINPKTGKPVATTDDSENSRRSEPAAGDHRVNERDIARKYDAIYGGLAAAGVPAGQLSRVARLIDASSVLVDEDGVEGLAEQIESLKADYADFFKRPRTKAPDAAVVGGGKKPVAKAESRTWEDEVRSRFNQGLI